MAKIVASFFKKHQNKFLALFLDITALFLLSFLDYQLRSILIKPPLPGTINFTPLVSIPWIIFIPILVSQILVMSFTSKKLLKTKKEIKVVHLLFFVLASAFPLSLLVSAYIADYFYRGIQCQAEIASGNHEAACLNEDFGKGVVVLLMIFVLILVLSLISLFINLYSVHLKGGAYRKFIVKVVFILFFLGIAFSTIMKILFIIEESQRPKVAPRPQDWEVTNYYYLEAPSPNR